MTFHAIPGMPLEIPAQVANRWTQAAGIIIDGQPAEGSPSGTPPPESTVIIRNVSEVDVPQFGVLEIDKPFFWSSEQMMKQRAFYGKLPEITIRPGSIVITAEPISNGRWGRAYIHGVVPCRLNVLDESHQYADVENPANVNRLSSSEDGALRIVESWEQGDGEDYWALIELTRRVPFGGDGSAGMVKQLESVGGVLKEVYDYPRMHGA